MAMVSVQVAGQMTKSLNKLSEAMYVASVELQQLKKELLENGIDKMYQKKPRFIKRFSCN